MDEQLNMSMRKFLKQVGVTSQQAIEAALRDAHEAGRLPPGPLRARAVVTVEGLDLEHVVDGVIRTGESV